MQHLPNATIIGFSSRYSARHLFTKPLHYLIQIVTGSKLHHVGGICDDFLYEATKSTGVRKIPLGVKLGEIDDCVDVIKYEPTFTLTPSKFEAFKIDFDNQIGKQYPTLQAFLSTVTAILFLGLRESKPKTKKMFCSKLIFYAYQKMFPEILGGMLPRTFNPEECIKILLKAGLIKEGELLNK